MVGKTAMEIHDEVVKVLTEANLMVIINNHVRKLKVRPFGLLSGAHWFQIPNPKLAKN